ncbi:patatin-like phospholipase family protein [Stieleria sp. TO1_6]|uniref:patatin-like phospholipase family protein n=1 Tax=Stieleria tagensis TaxID=2956795 RepID=UPI00209ADEA7|nr:patatin-like phospholipase family protein [Stieleria tagensis]MCO8121514.1 patatin-like phospholipase family protein [Stieleria tagensis]
MNRIGLALSGGGFRATLYHLGVLRFLRDAGRLTQVSHITSVSGGSIVAAHLVLNWDQYTGSDEDFDQAANDLLDFIRMDIRNRVVRRFPMAAVTNAVRVVIRAGRSRRLTRPGLLESHYEKFLYGDKCLYELPTVPQLHILATNVNEGCLCSFTRQGLLVQHRQPDGTTRFQPVPSALATVPMAVTASSAFPGFFPPLLLNASDVGADDSQFPPHLFTDGGVYDNLGVRMFRYIQDSWMGQDSPLHRDDFIDITLAAQSIDQASDEGAPGLAKLARMIRMRTESKGSEISSETLSDALWNVIVLDKLYKEPMFDSVLTDHPKAGDLHRLVRHGRELDRGDHLWLNRYLANDVYKAATGSDLFHSLEPSFDAVLVSDAGKQFTVSRRTKGGGLVGTAMRASDIVMNRVWELECDHFQSEPDFIFAPMKTMVHLADDPHALHPELQRQVTNTRTDLDRFSELEISGLIQHGYGVMRKISRSRPDLFGDDLPTGPPWDPTSSRDGKSATSKGPSQTTRDARQLQSSSQRQIMGHLFNLRDWPTYVYVPLLLFLLLGVPIFFYQQYKVSHRSELIVDAITFSNPDFQLVLQLARQNPVPGQWESLIADEVPALEPEEFSGFRMITDTRVLDARAWRPGSTSPQNRIVTYRRMLVRRIKKEIDVEAIRNQDPGRFRIQQFTPASIVSVRSSSGQLNPTLRFTPQSVAGEVGFMYEAEFDLSTVPTGEDFEIGFEVTSPGIQGREDQRARLTFPIIAPTDVATMWVLLPPKMPYRNVEIVAYEQAKPSLVEAIEPTYRFDMADGSLFGWMLVAPREDYIYESRVSWLDD